VVFREFGELESGK